MDPLLDFFHSDHDDDFLDVELQMLQAWLVVANSSKCYTVYTAFLHKYGGENVAITYFMSHFSMFFPTRATLKLDNENMRHAQGIGLFYVILLTVPSYIRWKQFLILQVTLQTPSHQVSSKCMLVFKGLHLNLLNIVILLTFKSVLWYYPTRLKQKLDYLQI